MDPIYEKVDDTTLKVTMPVETPEVVANIYDLDALKSQEVAILKQKNDFVEARNKELQEVRLFISQCEKLGIRSKLEVSLETEVSKIVE